MAISTQLGFAQDDFLVTLEKDTIRGKLGFLRKSYYDAVELKNEDGKRTFKSYQIQSAYSRGETYIPITFKNRRVIGKLIEQGNLSHYQIMTEETNGFGSGVLIKEDGSFLQISTLGLRKRLIEFINSCPTLVDKIENKEISASNLSEVISFYNGECTSSSTSSEEVIQESNDANQLKEFAQLIIDIQKKMDAGETVPSYMINALKSTDVQSMHEDLKDLIKKLESQ